MIPNTNKTTPEDQYKEYIDKHKQGVLDAFMNIVYPNIKDNVEEEMLDSILELIDSHDDSKYSKEEFDAYCNKFYKKHTNYNKEKFDLAWNHHQKCNPHHWQYWCLINDVDEPQISPQEMPFEYIIEMLCDWSSAGKFYGNTAYEWYSNQKDKMILHEDTREIIETFIILFR